MVEAGELRKACGSTAALDGIRFDVPQGEVISLIGPDGSGKAITLRVLSTLIKPTSGTAVVMGQDVLREARKVEGPISCPPG
jgi:ABC-2 type transport system ATP-binding protein